MYWKEAYKTRTKEAYQGYNTIYNNEPRLDFAELLDHRERFTEVYKECKNDPPAIREAKCLDAQFPQIMLGIMPNDLFCGRAAGLVNAGKIRLTDLISDRLPLDDINEVFKIRGKNGKMMIFPNE